MPKASAPKRAVRGGVAVAAHDGHAGQSQAEFGPDDVNDAAVRAAQAIERNAKLCRVGFQLTDLRGGQRVGDGHIGRGGGDGMVIVATVLSGRRTFNRAGASR